jgi:hypothetical protein
MAGTVVSETGRDAHVAAGVVCLAVASLGQLAQYLVTPVASIGGAPAEMVAEAVAHPAAIRAASWLDVAILFLVPAVLVVGRLAGAPRSVPAAVATAVAFVSTLLGSGYLLVVDVLVQLPGAAPTVAAYLDDPLVSTVTVVFLGGHVLGFLLLAVALWRARTVPVWAAAALLLSPLAEIGGQAAGIPAVTVAAYVLLVAAFAACARAVRVGAVRTGTVAPIAS